MTEIYIFARNNNNEHPYVAGVVGLNNGENSKVENITTNNININSELIYNVGGIVAYNNGGKVSIINADNIHITICGENTSIYGNGNVGGIVGYNNKQIEKIRIENSTITVSEAINIGMICGSNYENTSISNGIASGRISNNAAWYVGGIAGSSSKGSTVEYCHSNVEINGGSYIGGIIGQTNGSTIQNCAYTNKILNGENIGGIIGNGDNYNSTTTISNCYMNGEIPSSPNSGAVIGTITASRGTINVGTTDGIVYYNQAYRWLGYASSIPTGVTLNYNCMKQNSTDLKNGTDNLKSSIQNNISSTSS
ncbi:MAG: hypothetical protein ACI4UE_05045 [Candidatus Scatovivens sp.]